MNYEEIVEVMKNLSFLILLSAALVLSVSMQGQLLGWLRPSNDAIDCDPGWTPGSPVALVAQPLKRAIATPRRAPTYDPCFRLDRRLRHELHSD